MLFMFGRGEDEDSSSGGKLWGAVRRRISENTLTIFIREMHTDQHRRCDNKRSLAFG